MLNCFWVAICQKKNEGILVLTCDCLTSTAFSLINDTSSPALVNGYLKYTEHILWWKDGDTFCNIQPLSRLVLIWDKKSFFHGEPKPDVFYCLLDLNCEGRKIKSVTSSPTQASYYLKFKITFLRKPRPKC